MVSSSIKAAAGAEIDPILTRGKRRIAVECKASSAPEVGKGLWKALKALKIKEAWIIAPVKESYPSKREYPWRTSLISWQKLKVLYVLGVKLRVEPVRV